jgi:hypothetical protein
MPELEQLASAAPRAASLERGDEDDPRPWLEAYDAGVGSPLELRFLRVFEAHGIDVQKQVPMSAEEGGPIISIADFVVTGTKTAIYVDGASFHRGNRLRRDRAIRKRLREGGFHWRVVELSSHHLAEVASLVAALKGAP